jgi:UDP-N-acetylmuramate dehydrogenase
MMEKIRGIIEQCLEKNPCTVEFRFNEPMTAHTSFKVGGPAECWVRPHGDDSYGFTAALINAAHSEQIPLFILGGGANVLISDRGIRGITVDTGGWTGLADTGGTRRAAETELLFRSGTSLDEAADAAAARGLGGLEFLAGMPGSVGGALWMNARAFEREIGDVVVEAEIIDFSGSKAERRVVQTSKSEFSYKRSPFQNQRWLILSARCALHPRSEKEISAAMEEYRRDRQSKGHYRFPSAGSAFKNNRSYGKPSGQIIDELGLKGLNIGGAQIAPFHGNIIINTGGATAQNIRNLLERTAAQVKKATGFSLEPEIQFAGDW